MPSLPPSGPHRTSSIVSRAPGCCCRRLAGCRFGVSRKPAGVFVRSAVDDYVDPDDWTKACVLDEHKRKTDELRGVLRAIGVWDANTRHRLIHGTVPDPLLPPRTAPLRSSSNADERSTAETETATAAPPTPPPAKAPATPT
eukprot:GHVT01020390.1.p1 GENE.GHVT01020390.1~~GHVT01020390.1.p1  ORF type:complete len:142 (+),score=31.45 GHVT01020390.1:289-714(+)